MSTEPHAMPDSGRQERMGLETVIALLTRIEKRVNEMDEKLDDHDRQVDTKLKERDVKLSELTTARDKLNGAIGIIHWVGGAIAGTLGAGFLGLAGFFLAHALDLNTLHSEIKRVDARVDTSNRDQENASKSLEDRLNAQATRLTADETKLQNIDVNQITNDHTQLKAIGDDMTKIKSDVSDIQTEERRHDDELITLTTSAPTKQRTK